MDIEISAHTKWKSRHHFVWGTKYRYQIITKEVRNYLKEIIIGICERYGYIFDCVGTDGDHVHLFIGSSPSDSPEVIMKTIKSITAKKLFERFPSLKNILWGGNLWSIGYYWATVGEEKSEKVMRQYVINQGTEKEKSLITQLKLI